MTENQAINIFEKSSGSKCTGSRVSPNGTVWFRFGGGRWISEQRLHQLAASHS